MKFFRTFFVLVVLSMFSGVGSAKAVGEEVCGLVGDIVSLMPTTLSYVEGNRLRCSLRRGCRWYWRCRTDDLAGVMDFTLTQLCNALTQYGPDFFPNSAFPEINDELLNIQNSLGDIDSLLGGQGLISELELDANFVSIEDSLGNIENLVPVPEEQSSSRWTRRRSRCYNDDIALPEDDVEEEEPAEELTEEEIACNQGVDDLDNVTEESDACEGDADGEQSENDSSADYQSQLDSEIEATCGTDTAAVGYDQCVADVEEVFVYVPGDAGVDTDQIVEDAIGESGIDPDLIPGADPGVDPDADPGADPGVGDPAIEDCVDLPDGVDPSVLPPGIEACP